MKREWTIRSYKESDEEGVYELWRAVHSSEVQRKEDWLAWWRWKYQGGPAGAAKIWMAEHSGTIVGLYPVIFAKAKVGDDFLKVAQNTDLMTHPGYRQQGIFTTLERAALDELEKQAVHVTIGFPNEAAYPGHRKSGWFDVSLMRAMVKPLQFNDALKLKVKNGFMRRLVATGASLVFNDIFRSRRIPAVEGLTIKNIGSFDERFDVFWKDWVNVSGQFRIMIERSKEYLNWRYSAPNASYSILAAEKEGRIHGYMVLGYRSENSVRLAFIFTLLALSTDVMNILIRTAIAESRVNQASVIIYYLLASRNYFQVLKENGFASVPFTKRIRFAAYSSSSSISKQLLSNPGNWFVQLGDSDAT